MKKIIHLGYMHKHSDTRIFEKECKSLLKLDNVNVFFITSDRTGFFAGEKDRITIETIKLKDVRFVRLFIYINELKKKCMELDGDVYHIHEPYLLPLIPFLKRKKKKIIYDKHESTYDDCKERISRKFNNVIGKIVAETLNFYEEKCINLCDGYIYVTPQFEIKNVKCDSLLIPNFPKTNGDEQKIIGMKTTGETRICYCGGIAPIWSISELANIIKAEVIDNVTFHIAGNGSKGYLEEIKNEDINNRIIMHGQVPFHAVREIYSSGHIGAALLKKELGEKVNDDGTLANTKIFEYMQQGLPVIFTDFPVWKKICDEFEFGIAVDPTNSEEIINAIRYLKNNPEISQKLGMNGKRAIQEKYNWQKTEDDFLDLYRKVLSE